MAEKKWENVRTGTWEQEKGNGRPAQTRSRTKSLARQPESGLARAPSIFLLQPPLPHHPRLLARRTRPNAYNDHQSFVSLGFGPPPGAPFFSCPLLRPSVRFVSLALPRRSARSRQPGPAAELLGLCCTTTRHVDITRRSWKRSPATLGRLQPPRPIWEPRAWSADPVGSQELPAVASRPPRPLVLKARE